MTSPKSKTVTGKLSIYTVPIRWAKIVIVRVISAHRIKFLEPRTRNLIAKRWVLLY